MNIDQLDKLWIKDTRQTYAGISMFRFKTQILLFNLLDWKYSVHHASEAEFKIIINQWMLKSD